MDALYLTKTEKELLRVFDAMQKHNKSAQGQQTALLLAQLSNANSFPVLGSLLTKRTKYQVENPPSMGHKKQK